MDYESLLKLPSGTDDILYLFKTIRANQPNYAGSTYASHSDATTTGYREPSNRRGKGYEIQPRSGKTVYMSLEDASKVAGYFQNLDMGVRFVPVMKDGKPTGTAALELTEDYGPRKAGERLATVPYTTKPQVGMSPVEIYRQDSPVGDAGRGIHFGNKITEVYPRPSRLGPAKTGIAALVAGGAGAVKAATQGNFTPARELVGEMLTPLSMTPSDANRGEQEWIDRYGSAARRRNEQEAEKALERLRGYSRGGNILMPEEYSSGGWKLI